ncbi:glycosyltransferase family 2 protein [Beduini massiliensis]|uniref:glycosyltransferase family 2 protein n=1 Tax=Beduini massiliensis TaxID=1585974 RepID=UPI00059A9C14|nr:glycosyltransferase [Beduini massiliensis]
MEQKKHTFAICAYKESEYLEDCIRSLEDQKQDTQIIIVTSTPNDYISALANKYELPLFINTGKRGITEDWNFAYKMANTNYVTIAHQDDLYYQDYAFEAIRYLDKHSNTLIYFTDYAEIRNNATIYDNRLLRIKRIMLSPLKIKKFGNSIFIRRRILSLGCPICCPSVTFVKSNLPEMVFTSGFRSDEDWEAWEKLSKLKGRFGYNSKVLMGHRIHDGSETSAIINDNVRNKEDLQMFNKFWPLPIAKFLTKIYANSEKSNELNE